MNNFNIQTRCLRADEVVLRPAEVKGNKVTLLLYQDARCAMNILDETYGRFNWQKEYYESKGNLFCKVGVRDTENGEWVWKSDTGSESNIEAEKGLASDAFKRAAVAWGIGRELYTAPKIVIDLTDKDYYNEKYCQTFHLGSLEVTDGNITALTIYDKWDNLRYTYPCNKSYTAIQTSKPQCSTQTKAEVADVKSEKGLTAKEQKLEDFYNAMKVQEGVDANELLRFYNFYMGKDKDNHSISIVESWKNPEPEQMWEKWQRNKIKN